jgi:endonuclease III
MALSPARARAIMAKLETQHPGADTELHFRTAFELLVATMLSAQSTDERVNTVTPALFAEFPDARALAVADPARVEPIILQTGFFRQKAKSIIRTAQLLVERHDGEVPAEMAALVDLPGVGRKTANVVLGHALGLPGLPVDRHVLRVSNRIGLAEGDDPVRVEEQLCGLIARERWTLASDTLILHGRRVCRPKPECERCAVREGCAYFRALASDAAARSAGRTAAKTAGRTPGARRPGASRKPPASAVRKPAAKKASRRAAARRPKR